MSGWGALRFRGGDEAQVHRVVSPGGSLSFASRFRFDSTHSLPQATSAGAKPNHGFFHCQHPRGVFSGRRGWTRTPLRIAGAPPMVRAKTRRDARGLRRSRKKHYVLSILFCARRGRAGSSRRSGAMRERAPRRCGGRFRNPQNFFCGRPFFCPAQVDLREFARTSDRPNAVAACRERVSKRGAQVKIGASFERIAMPAACAPRWMSQRLRCPGGANRQPGKRGVIRSRARTSLRSAGLQKTRSVSAAGWARQGERGRAQWSSSSSSSA